MPRILVIEDDHDIAESTVLGLRRAGFTVDHAADGTTGLAAWRDGPYDLVVLDLGLPGTSGHTVLEAIRTDSAVPVIVITARTGLDPRLRSFRLGADDLLPKPFWLEELVARIRRRLSHVDLHRRVRWGSVVVDLDAPRVTVNGVDAGLTASELAVLLHLVARPQRAITRAQLLEHALPEDTTALERTVDSHVARVRRKLGDDGAAIETVFRLGYRFVPS